MAIHVDYYIEWQSLKVICRAVRKTKGKIRDATHIERRKPGIEKGQCSGHGPHGV